MFNTVLIRVKMMSKSMFSFTHSKVRKISRLHMTLSFSKVVNIKSVKILTTLFNFSILTAKIVIVYFLKSKKQLIKLLIMATMIRITKSSKKKLKHKVSNPIR
jgi:hypothetical protein